MIPIIPTILETTNNKDTYYDLYSRLLKDRIIFLEGEIDTHKSTIIVSELLYLNSLNHEDIHLYINSPGGEVSAGLSIYDTMNYIESDVSTICIGMCASMASIILSSGTHGKRYALKNSEVMIHQPLGGTQGQAIDLKIGSDHILKVRNKLNKILSKNTNKSIKRIEKDTDRDNFLDSNEALKYGLIDKIL